MKQVKPRFIGRPADSGSSKPGSRNGWWIDNCDKHGETSFNSIINGCEQCARERLDPK